MFKKATQLIALVLITFAWSSMSQAWTTSKCGGSRFQELKSDILDHEIKSSQQLLHFFKTNPKYKSLVDSPVLEFESDALHGDEVSPRFPRIVLGDGTLTLHLIGDPTSKSSQLIELVEYLPCDGRFSFSVVNFALWNDPRMFLEDIDFKTQVDIETSSLYTKTTGQFITCAGCHPGSGNTLLPVWNPSSSLHRAFGNGEDLIDPIHSEVFAEFLETRKDPELGKLYSELNIEFSETSDGLKLNRNPNKKLTEHIFKSLRARMAFVLTEPNRASKIFATAGAFLDCEEIESFVPESARTKHEETLLEALGSYPLLIHQVDEESLSPGYKDHLEVSEGNFAYLLRKGDVVINEKSFIMHYTGPLPKALQFAVRRSNEILSFFTSRRMPPMALAAPVRLIEDEFLSEEYLSIIGKLRFIHEGIGDGMPFVLGEFDVHGGHPHMSYRMDEGIKGLRKVLSEEIGPQFLKKYPDLDYFRGGKMEVDHLTVPLPTYCELLRKKSIASWE